MYATEAMMMMTATTVVETAVELSAAAHQALHGGQRLPAQRGDEAREAAHISGRCSGCRRSRSCGLVVIYINLLVVFFLVVVDD